MQAQHPRRQCKWSDKSRERSAVISEPKFVSRACDRGFRAFSPAACELSHIYCHSAIVGTWRREHCVRRYALCTWTRDRCLKRNKISLINCHGKGTVRGLQYCMLHTQIRLPCARIGRRRNALIPFYWHELRLRTTVPRR